MSKSKRLASTAILTALITIISMLSLPIGAVPVSFQCFAVALGGYLCGARTAVTSTVLYICIGAVGLPVFSGFRGGVGVLVDHTGGFLWGFIALALLCGLALGKKKAVAIPLGLLGLVICHTAGAAQFCLVSGVDIKSAFLTASAPFIVKDLLFISAAQLLSVPILKALRKNEKDK